MIPIHLFALLVAAFALATAGIGLRASRAPGWRELRWFSAAVLAASGQLVLELMRDRLDPVPVQVAGLAELALLLGSLWAWARYAEGASRTRVGRPGRAAELALPLALAVAPFPAVDRLVPLLVLPVALAIPLRFLSAHRRGVPFAGRQAIAFAAMMLLTLGDILDPASRSGLPSLFDLGASLAVAAAGWACAARFVDAGLDLETLRTRLEALVEERTRALAEAQEALVRAERLASLGDLARGVTHQLSNPAAVVTASLNYLSDGLPARGEAREVATEALDAMHRINDLVRRLADAGRMAASSRATSALELRGLVEQALGALRQRLPGELALEVDVPPGLFVRTRAEILEQVLGALLANAADAHRPGGPGRIELKAEPRAGGIRLTVRDDGLGMAPEVLERAFEPFFTTKPAGLGHGLGLAVSRAVVEVQGGALWLESAPGQGTTAVLVLPQAHAPTPAPEPAP